MGYEKHPKAPWLRRKQSGQDVLVNKNEHLADAVAAIHTGMQTDQFRRCAMFLSLSFDFIDR